MTPYFCTLSKNVLFVNFQFPLTALKVMTSYIFSIVTTSEIWACHMTCIVKLSKHFMSPDTLLDFRKSSLCKLVQYSRSYDDPKTVEQIY